MLFFVATFLFKSLFKFVFKLNAMSGYFKH
jgi:hypothetical protein